MNLNITIRIAVAGELDAAEIADAVGADLREALEGYIAEFGTDLHEQAHCSMGALIAPEWAGSEEIFITDPAGTFEAM